MFFCRFKKAPLALLSLAFISLSAPTSDVTMLPRYVNDVLLVRLLSCSCILAGCLVFHDITSVFLVFIFSQFFSAFFCNFDVVLCTCFSICDSRARSSA